MSNFLATHMASLKMIGAAVGVAVGVYAWTESQFTVLHEELIASERRIIEHLDAQKNELSREHNSQTVSTLTQMVNIARGLGYVDGRMDSNLDGHSTPRGALAPDDEEH